MEPGLAERPIFSAGGRAARRRDVLAWARGSGRLAALEHESAAGLAALERDGPPPAADVRAAGAAFRYARSLLAADELDAWLAGRGLTTDEWLEHLRRTVARDRASGSEPQSPPPAAERAVWVDAICSGALERWARELAVRRAVAPDAPDGELEARFEDFRRAVATDEAVAREIEGRALDWLHVEGELVSVADEDVARELALCAREDGEPLDALAGRAGTELQPLDAYLEDVAPELAAALLGAREGEILGPVAVDGRQLILHALRKAAPSPQDPELRARARELLVARAVERELETHVEWHDRA